MSTTVAAVAGWVNGEVIGDGQLVVERTQALSKAGPSSLTFLGEDKHARDLQLSKAGAALVRRSVAENLRGKVSMALIVVDDPKGAFIAIAGKWSKTRQRATIGISPAAHVSPSAIIGRHTNIHPGAYVGDDAVIGDHCEIHPGAVIGRGCRIGDRVTIHPHAVLYDDVIIGNRVILHSGCVIGADGFGYRTVAGKHERVPHLGTVRIEDDVEIGAATTVDRAMVDETVIGEGTKLDNLVMIGHNCEIGKHNLFVSQVGLAGSVTTGDYVVCAGQVGIADHVHLGAKAVIGAKAGVHKDLPGGGFYIGQPAIPQSEAKRVVLAQQKVPEMRQQIRALERQVAALVAQLAAASNDSPTNTKAA